MFFPLKISSIAELILKGGVGLAECGMSSCVPLVVRGGNPQDIKNFELKLYIFLSNRFCHLYLLPGIFSVWT